MPRRIVLDIETSSGYDLKKLGAYKYFSHPWARAGFISWADVTDGHARAQVKSYIPATGEPTPRELTSIGRGDTVVAHRASFERAGLLAETGRRLGLHLDDVTWDCTRVRATAFGLPPSLNEAAKALGYGEKLELPDKFFAPDTEAPTREFDLKRAEVLKDYCPRDVELSVKLDARLPKLSAFDARLMSVDAKINDRGILLDRGAAEAFALACERAKPQLIADCIARHGVKPTSPKQLLPKLLAYGVDTADARADTLRMLLKSDRLPANARELIELRLEAAQNAGSKYRVAIAAAMEDGRLRGMFQFFAALNGRWGSYVVQLQNMKRSLSKATGKEFTDAEVAAILDVIAGGGTIGYGESCGLVRHMLVASPGQRLLSIDLKQIEARVLSWLADAFARLDVFRDPSADIYTATAAAIGGTRFDGKIAELSFGYQGGAGAAIRGARKYGAYLSEHAAQQRVYAWRNAPMNRPIVNFWGDIERAAIDTVRRGLVMKREGKLVFGMHDDCLRMTLPSGTHIYYQRPKIGRDGKLTFFGMNTHTRQYEEDASLYGGRLAQNATSKTARDVIGGGMLRTAAAGADLVGSVHDELIIEGKPTDAPELEALVTELEGWMDPTLPIAADTSVRHRYA